MVIDPRGNFRNFWYSEVYELYIPLNILFYVYFIPSETTKNTDTTVYANTHPKLTSTTIKEELGILVLVNKL